MPRAEAEIAINQRPPDYTTGRPTDYNPAFLPIVERLCNHGATDSEIADLIGVSRRTIDRWKLEHEDFCRIVRNGKEICDERVERSFYHRSLGYEYEEDHAFKLKDSNGNERVEIVKITKHQPADPGASFNWLKNRKYREWRDRREFAAELNVTENRTIDPRRLDPDQRELLKQLLIAASSPAEDAEFQEVGEDDQDDEL